jgi:hypothetical protein
MRFTSVRASSRSVVPASRKDQRHQKQGADLHREVSATRQDDEADAAVGRLELTSFADLVIQSTSWATSTMFTEFRNYIHPYKEHTDGVEIAAEDARMFWEVCKAIIRQVLASV